MRRKWNNLVKLLLILLSMSIVHLIFLGTYTAKFRYADRRMNYSTANFAFARNHRLDNGTMPLSPPLHCTSSPTTIRVSATELPQTITDTCELPGIIQNGVPWPDCLAKYGWMKNNWKIDKCYAEHGVNGDPCTILKYLSNEEKHCPPVGNKKHTVKLNEHHLSGLIAESRKSFRHLYNELANISDYKWMENRIRSMEKLWLENSKAFFTEQPTPRVRKRILLHLGLMSLGIGKDAFKGGPLGELVQWSDLIASLFVMGHDIVLTKNKAELTFVFKDYINAWGKSPCPPKSFNNVSKATFDIIYTDIRGYKEWVRVLGEVKAQPLKCRLRIVDSFGTEAAFNHPQYRDAKKLRKSQYNGINLKLPQFNVMFPHSPDNTFLGFVTEFSKHERNDANLSTDPGKRNIALVYGKLEKFWEGKEKYIDIIKEYVDEVHATVHSPKHLRQYIINHGIIGPDELNKLLLRTKIFVGLGFPFEGPAPLEAIQNGAIFLNPHFSEPISSLNHKFYKDKPTRRRVTSQNPYAEKYIGKPHVYTVNIDDEKALRSALNEIMNSTAPGKYLAYEFSVRGMLERVSIQVEKQQFCVDIPCDPNNKEIEKLRWPPLSALQIKFAAKPGRHDCNDICDDAGLICEPSFFSILNRKDIFEDVGLICNETMHSRKQEVDFPAFDETNGICYLQTNSYLFSCSGNYMNMRRICPCRDFMKGQVALCKHCGVS